MKKIATIVFIFGSDEFELNNITEEYVRKVLSEEKVFYENQGFEGKIISVEQIDSTKKKATVQLIYDEQYYDLDIITEEWVKRVLKDRNLAFLAGEGPEVASVTVEELEKES